MWQVKEMKSFEGTLTLITGGSSGIGFALARRLVQAGADVFILARNKERLESAIEALKLDLVNPDQKIGSIKADITDYKHLEKLLTGWVEQEGIPDFVFNSAGVAHPGYFEELDIEIFHWMMDVNYHGMVNVTKVLLPYMRNRASGHFINISSEAGFIGIFGYTAYGASKYAVRGFSDALRAEMKPLGINVSIVFPPDTDTPQLAYENKIKPYETKVIASTSKTLTADLVAERTLKGVQKNKYMIIPSLEGRIFYRLSSILKHTTYRVMDLLVKSARKKKFRQMNVSDD